MRYDPAILNIFCEECGAFDTANLADDACYLGTDELEAGMVLAQDLYSEKGMILLRKGHALTSELINRLSHLQNWSGRTLDVAVEKQTDSTKEIGG